jgi:hypothetical protein
MSTFYVYYPPGGGSSANASVGSTGVTAPTSATEVAGINPSGNLQPLQTDASGYLLVDLATPPVLSENIAQFGGNNVVTGTGASGLGIPRVTVSSDSSVLVSNFPATQTITGTVTANAGTGTFAVSAASLPLPTGAATSANQTNASQKTQIVDGSGNVIASTSNALNVNISSGTVTNSANGAPGSAAPAQATQVGGTDGTNLRALSVNSSGVLALPQGASTAANQATANTSLAAIATSTANIPPLGQALATASVPVVLTAAQLSTLTPLSTVAVSAISGALPAGTNNLGSVTNITGTVSLPTGAATAANQATQISSLTTIATNTGTAPSSPGNSNAPVYLTYSSSNVTTSAYTQLIASTSAATTYVDIFDSSGQAMILATGAAGSEAILAYIPPGGDQIRVKIPAGIRVAYKALTANATSGYLLLNLYQ